MLPHSEPDLGWLVPCLPHFVPRKLVGWVPFHRTPPRSPAPARSRNSPSSEAKTSKMQYLDLYKRAPYNHMRHPAFPRGPPPLPAATAPAQMQATKMQQSKIVKYTAPGLPALSACPPFLSHTMMSVGRQPQQPQLRPNEGW